METTVVYRGYVFSNLGLGFTLQGQGEGLGVSVACSELGLASRV